MIIKDEKLREIGGGILIVRRLFSDETRALLVIPRTEAVNLQDDH